MTPTEITPSTLVENETEKLGKITEFYGLNEQIRSVHSIRNNIAKETEKLLPTDDAAILDSKLAAYSLEEVKALTSDEVDAIYNLEDGELEFTPLFKERARQDEFKKDFLVFLKEQSVNESKIDAELARLEEESAKFEPEFEELIKEFNDIGLYLRNKMSVEMDDPETTPERRKKLATMVEAFDDTYTLNRIHENVLKLSTSNMLNDYRNRDEAIYAKYLKVLKTLDLKVDLTRFGSLEERFLEEKYNKYPNLFMFIILKHYAYLKNVDKGVDGVFLSQLSVVLKGLYTDTISEDKKETFLNSVRRTLDLFV